MTFHDFFAGMGSLGWFTGFQLLFYRVMCGRGGKRCLRLREYGIPWLLLAAGSGEQQRRFRRILARRRHLLDARRRFLLHSRQREAAGGSGLCPCDLCVPVIEMILSS